MLFTSEAFLFLFLPFTVLIYYLFLVKHTLMKNVFLLIMSLAFYAYGGTKEYYLDDHYDYSPLLLCDDDFMDESKR